MRWRRHIGRASLRLLRSRIFWAALLISVFAANAAWCWRNRVNGDVAWYLYAVTRLSHGAVLYQDIHDFNLPLVYLIYLPFAWLSRLFGLPIQVVMYTGLWSLVGGVLISLRRTPGMSSIGRRLMLLIIAFAALSLHRLDLGQRDPICALLFTGLVISTYRRIQRPGGRSGGSWMTILAAALGIAIKPHFLIPWMLVMAGLALHVGVRRALRMPESWLPPLVSAISWAATLAAFPDYLAMASMASRYYSGLNGSLWLFLPLLLPLSVAVAAFLRNTGPGIRSLIQLSALATTGFAIESLMQRKGFPYHLAPSMFWGFITAGLLFVDMLRRSRGRLASWRISAGTVLGSVGLAGYSLWSATVPPPPVFARTDVDEFVLKHARGRMVLSLSTNLWIAFPLILEAGATNARPDPSLWAMGGMYQDQVARAMDSPAPTAARYHARAEMSDDERKSFDQVVSVLTGSRPAVILVQTGPWKQGLGRLQFDFIDYFSTDERFREALRSYKPGPSDARRLALVRPDL